MKPYMSYTTHFINDDWKLTCRCLQTHFMPDDHTADNLSEAMLVTLEAWSLDQVNQVCNTTDNGANIIKAADNLGWPRLSCFGHNLHLAITKAVTDDDGRCSRALGVCRKIVSSFSMSWRCRRELSIKSTTEFQSP